MDAIEAGRARRDAWDGLEECYNGCRRGVFEPRARELVARAELEPGARILDMGTGTGIAAFEALKGVGPTGEVLGVDSSPGLLRTARKEAQRRGVGNVAFVQTSMTDLGLRNGCFDRVVANFSICCATSYEETLQEAHRVLRAGGTITYNHEGPRLNPVDTAYKEILERHRLSDPPAHVRRVREASALIDEGWSEYKDPFAAMEALQSAGFRDVTATISLEQRAHQTLEEYLDYKLSGSMEVEVLPPDRQMRLRDALQEALQPHVADDGLVFQQEVLTLQGTK